MTTATKTPQFRLMRPFTGRVLFEARTLRECLTRKTIHEALGGLKGPLRVEALDPQGRWVHLSDVALPEE